MSAKPPVRCDVLVVEKHFGEVCVFVWYALLCVCFPAVPANISELKNVEVLNMFNNQIEELPTQLSSLQKLKHLNLG